jgi:predicted phosphodiesterase
MPREAMDLLLALDPPAGFICGNGDREVLSRMRDIETNAVPERFREPIRWTARALAAEHEQVIAGWPASLELGITGIGKVLFCHATPRNDTEIFTRLTPEERLEPAFAGVNVPLVVCGHTHMQFDRRVGTTRIVNAGSVGMPFGEPGAYWLLLGPHVQFRRTTYDLLAAAERIRATAYPLSDEFATRNVLRPPSEDETLKSLRAAELT